MKKFVLRSVILIFGCLLVLSSCSNFANSSELKDKLDKAIDYANSDPVDLYFSSTHGKISPSGKISYKVTDQISLMFNEDNDWQFVKWQIFDQNDNDISDLGYISMEDWESSTTKATFEKNPKNITLNIVPLCASRPKVISWTPSLNSDGAYRDARIAVSFDHGIHQDSIYFTDAEIENLKKKGVTDFLQISSSSEEWTYGYKKDGKIFYKNISIYDKETGENLLDRYGEPEFEGNDTFVLPTKNGENAPIAGTQIIVELKDFFYEHDDESLKDENRIIKMNGSQKWHYFVNGNTDTLAPSLPDGYFINTSGKDLEDKERAILKTSLNVNNQNDLKSIYLKDKKLHVKASVFDSGSGLAPSGYSNGKIVSSGLWVKVKRVYNEHYIPVTESEKTVYLPVKTVSSIATCDTEIDFASMNMKDGIYHIDFYAKDKNGNGTTKVLKDGGFVLIDETAPDKVEGLSVTYYGSAQTLSVNWGLPGNNGLTVNDYSHAIIGAKKIDSNGNETTIAENVTIKPSSSDTGTNYTLTGIDATELGTKYVFTVKTVDIFGNTLNEAQAEKTPVTATYLREILLNKYHFAYNSTEKITATAYFDDVNLSGNTVSMRLYSGTTNKQTVNVTVDEKTGQAQGTFNLPSTSSSNAGVTYTIKLLIDGNVAKNKEGNEVSTRFNISDLPSISSAVLSIDKISLAEVRQNKTKITATVTGYNMDLEDKLKMEIIDSGNKTVKTTEISTENIKWTATNGNTGTDTLTISEFIPEVDDTYTVKITSGTSTVSKTLYVYDAPRFTAVTIPNASTSKAGNTVKAILHGRNFNNPNFNTATITLSCGTLPEITGYKPTVTVNSDTSMSVTLPISTIPGDHKVTLKWGETSIVGTFHIKEPKEFNVGDLILSDGSRLDYDPNRTAFTEDDFKDANGKELEPIAVYYYTNADDIPLGVGIHNSYGDTIKRLEWAPSGTTGYNTNFTGIYGTKNSGDMDGSDNWAYVCSMDSEGKKNAEANYPAFNWANTYGTRYNLPENCRDGWYLPSCAELYKLYENKTVVNKVLGMIPNKYNPVQLYSYYWSSSQYGGNGYAASVNLDYGTVKSNYKDDTYYNYVCSIQALIY